MFFLVPKFFLTEKFHRNRKNEEVQPIFVDKEEEFG